MFIDCPTGIISSFHSYPPNQDDKVSVPALPWQVRSSNRNVPTLILNIHILHFNRDYDLIFKNVRIRSCLTEILYVALCKICHFYLYWYLEVHYISVSLAPITSFVKGNWYRSNRTYPTMIGMYFQLVSYNVSSFLTRHIKPDHTCVVITVQLQYS